MSVIQLQIPAHADFIDVVRLCLHGIASKMRFSYEDIEDMKVAISEACNNAVIYNHKEAKSNTIAICFEIVDTGLSIKIKDNGPGFNYALSLAEALPLQDTEVANLRSGGLGIYLMQALMDKVEVITNGGTEVIMTKYITDGNTIAGME
jgi:serine/threonine-protein kinase RsbW